MQRKPNSLPKVISKITIPSSASEYERFISYYPQDERREEVEFNRTLSYINNLLVIRLDQAPTLRAIESFNYSIIVTQIQLLLKKVHRKLINLEITRSKTYESGQFYSEDLRYKAGSYLFRSDDCTLKLNGQNLPCKNHRNLCQLC